MFEFPFGPTVVELTTGQFSDEVEFSVPTEAQETFLRIIALWRDNQALGGEAPTIEIRAGQGALTPLVVTTQGATTTQVAISGTDGAAAGTATCERDNNDVYLAHIFNIAPGNGPWQLRINNNDPQTLHFVAVSSTDAAETVQPWMIWGTAADSFSTTGNPDDLNFGLPSLYSRLAVAVRNLGTGPLNFAERAGHSIGKTTTGSTDSPVVIVYMPNQGNTDGRIDTHGVANIVFGVHSGGTDADQTVKYTMRTNDQLHAVTLTIWVQRTSPVSPPPGAPCNIDHCLGYIQEGPAYGPCLQANCQHDWRFHGLGPPCRLGDGCEGFIDNTRSRSAPPGVTCVQPGCGHDWVRHVTPPPPPPMPCTVCDCANWLPPLPPTPPGGPFCRRPGCGHTLRSHISDFPVEP